MCPECKSTNIIKTWSDPDESDFDEYECRDCGLALDFFLGEYLIAKSENVDLILRMSVV